MHPGLFVYVSVGGISVLELQEASEMALLSVVVLSIYIFQGSLFVPGWVGREILLVCCGLSGLSPAF